MSAADAVHLSEKQIRKRIFLGAVPLKLTLAGSDLAAMREPMPFFALVPRGHYLPMLTNKLKEFFAGSIATTAASSGDEVWFEYNAVPLKWHYPVGVLFDLLIDDPTTALPWPLTVHFHGFPSADLMRCPNDEAIRSLYTNALKEANYLKHGDGGRVNKLSLDDSNNLWHGLLRHEFDTFWSANDKLVCALPDDLKSVPLRLCERDRPASQVLFEPLTPANAHRSLADLLRSVYPDRFSSLLDTAPNDGHPVLALVQGVAPPLATSVFWLATHFSHPDNFLYIVIKTR